MRDSATCVPWIDVRYIVCGDHKAIHTSRVIVGGTGDGHFSVACARAADGSMAGTRCTHAGHGRPATEASLRRAAKPCKLKQWANINTVTAKESQRDRG